MKSTLSLPVLAGVAACALAPPGGRAETLYNGIQLSASWPPGDAEARIAKPPPYLLDRPAVVPIDVGRQLFVDDFLIETTTLRRNFHQPEKYAGNPVLKPETASEKTGGARPGQKRGAGGQYPEDASAASFDDGVIYDPVDGLFKLWYMSGELRDTALAYSKDGLHWERPSFDVVPGTNIVIPYDPTFVRDAFSPWKDPEAKDPAERYKAFLYSRTLHDGEGGYLYTSPDGIHWRQRAKLDKGVVGDDTSLFYNPYRRKWALSIRVSLPQFRRVRNYFESDDFLGLAKVTKSGEVFWTRADSVDDPPDPTWIVQNPTQLYAVSPLPYESLMLGLFSVHYGPENEVCDAGNYPKLTQIKVAFSRDGFYWDRSDNAVFIAATKKDGDWDRGYLRATGQGCLTVGDKLYFYYCGYSGHSGEHRGMYAGGSQHVAVLRRDGFASMDADAEGGELTTRPVKFGGKFLEVNLDAPEGALTVDVLDEDGRIIEPFSASRCAPLGVDATKARVTWAGGADLGRMAGRTVRFRFHLTRGRLYAFWVSPTESGESNGLFASPPTPSP